MSIGYTEILLILAIILLLFGAKRIPELAQAFGKASSEFKKAKNEQKEDVQSEMQSAENKNDTVN